MPRLFQALMLFDRTSGSKNNLRGPSCQFVHLAGQAFDPETIAKMSAALEKVCEGLNLKMEQTLPARFILRRGVTSAANSGA
jgi:hypothetical protein